MVKFNDISSQWSEIESEVLPKLTELLRNGPYILGTWGNKLEQTIASELWSMVGTGVGNATDGLRIALEALQEEQFTTLIIPANAHISDAMSPISIGYNVIFADCDQYGGLDPTEIDNALNSSAIDSSTPTILAVHMYGQACNIMSLRKSIQDAKIVEDCSQAYGATVQGKPVGSFGDAAVLSFYPTKNLGAMGDGGMVVTKSTEVGAKVRMLREYGSLDRIDYECVGWNSRLDEVQALILFHKLKLVPKWIKMRREIASIYNRLLSGVGDLVIPEKAPYADESTYHIYYVHTKKRNELKEYLSSKGIQSMIHYQKAIPQTKAFYDMNAEDKFPNACKHARECLSLPMHPYMTVDQIHEVITAIKGFYTHG